MAWRWSAQQVLEAPLETKTHPDNLQKLINFCQHNTLLSQFPPSSQIEMSKTMSIQYLDKGSTLFNQGDPVNSKSMFYIVLKGKLAVHYHAQFEVHRKENETIDEWWVASGGTLNTVDYGTFLNFCLRDAACGENLLKSYFRSASVLASERTTIITIPLNMLYHCMEEHPDTVITSQSILTILHTRPTNGDDGRSKGDALYVAGWMRQLRFFRQMPPKVLIKCAKHVYLMRYHNGDIVDEHHKMSEMTNMHVIIKGEYMILLYFLYYFFNFFFLTTRLLLSLCLSLSP